MLHGGIVTLPASYEAAFDRMLAEVADAAVELDTPLVPFWPLCGARYDAELMVVGRAVNGWVEDWTSRRLRDPAQRQDAVAFLRHDAEPVARDRMEWVTALWGATSGYSTRRSAFWRVLRRISGGDDPAADWPSRLVWTNLYKVSPAVGWNPGSNLQRVQRASAALLLRLELESFAPQRVLALTGNWLLPFVGPLGLDLEPTSGLVEGVGYRGGSAWVVAKHPMTKPEDRYVREVRAAFADLGAPLNVLR